MLSFFRPSRTYSHQIFNTRRRLCAFTSTIPIRRNVNHEETRKLSTSLFVCKPLSIEFYSAHSKENLLSAVNPRYWTSQFYGFQSFSRSSGPGRSDQSERDARTLMVAGLSKDTTVHSLRQYFIEKNWEVINCRIARDKKTGDSLKYGFVEFATVEQAELASKDRPFIDYKNVSATMKAGKEFEEKYRIFVGGLLKRTSAATLHHHFSKFGDIFESHIVRDDDNLSKGFGYVTYKSQDSVDRVLNSQSHSIDSQVVTVKHAPPRRRELTFFIGNLSPKTTDESLRKHFSKYGRLIQSEVKIDRQTGQSRGFGYIAFASQEELDRALKDQPHMIDDVEVEINYRTTELDLVVDSLPGNISEESLKKLLWDLFSRYGQVRDCRFIKNSAGTTTAFVALSSKDEVSRALNARPHRIDGKLICTHQKGEQFDLIVHGLPKDTTDENLYEIFSKTGKVVHWGVKRDPKNTTNRPLGYGFVSFSTAEESIMALAEQLDDEEDESFVNNRLSAMDNEVLLDTFKFLRYSQLAKSCHVSKNFRDFIRIHRHSLARLRVRRMHMGYNGNALQIPSSGRDDVEVFDTPLNRDDYDSWVLRNGYSKRDPFLDQYTGNPKDRYHIRYCLVAWTYPPSFQEEDEPNIYGMVVFSQRIFVFRATPELNQENFPLFQHFFNLLSDPFILVEELELIPPENQVWKHLLETTPQILNSAGVKRIQRYRVSLFPEGNNQDCLRWLKTCVL
ncbi:RNA recognition motif domain-containing protein [Ditylenchus destructor]|uniref:RNA recognition motif domain-containing protein n=1 Tax=Ditylenchus destructor TaxID=166010 RepID=A0AAD4R566_9BILA|nr:RNA recognition motif domain-containing protein [Ditylenchus destructor]